MTFSFYFFLTVQKASIISKESKAKKRRTNETEAEGSMAEYCIETTGCDSDGSSRSLKSSSSSSSNFVRPILLKRHQKEEEQQLQQQQQVLLPPLQVSTKKPRGRKNKKLQRQRLRMPEDDARCSQYHCFIIVGIGSPPKCMC